jgi:hypothetical protein
MVAPQILAMFDGLQIQWLLDPDGVDMVAAFEDFLGRLRARSWSSVRRLPRFAALTASSREG